MSNQLIVRAQWDVLRKRVLQVTRVYMNTHFMSGAPLMVCVQTYVKSNDHACPVRFTRKKACFKWPECTWTHTPCQVHHLETCWVCVCVCPQSIIFHTTTSAVFCEKYCCCQLRVLVVVGVPFDRDAPRLAREASPQRRTIVTLVMVCVQPCLLHVSCRCCKNAMTHVNSGTDHVNLKNNSQVCAHNCKRKHHCLPQPRENGVPQNKKLKLHVRNGLRCKKHVNTCVRVT